MDELTVERLVVNPKLQWHVGRLVEHLDLSINNLDDMDYVFTVQNNLGVRHQVYGVRKSQFQVTHVRLTICKLSISRG